jgi:hypothetical protein
MCESARKCVVRIQSCAVRRAAYERDWKCSHGDCDWRTDCGVARRKSQLAWEGVAAMRSSGAASELAAMEVVLTDTAVIDSLDRISELHEQLHILERVRWTTALRRWDADGKLHDYGYNYRGCRSAQYASDIGGELKAVSFYLLAASTNDLKSALIAGFLRDISYMLVFIRQPLL